MSTMEAVMIYKEVFLYARFMNDAEIATLIKYVGYAVFGYGDEVKLPAKLQDIADVIIEKHNAKELKYKKYCESRSNNRKAKTNNETTYENICNHMGDKLNLTNTNTNNKLNKEIDKEKSAKAPKRNTPVIPTREQIAEYCKERNNGIDADYFYDYYEARGWKYSNNQPMKDFKAAIRTWESKEKNKGGGAPAKRTRPISEIRGGGWVDTEFSNSWD